MSAMRELLRRVLYVLRYGSRQADLADELEFHRAMKALDLERRGLADRDADAGARRAMGNDLSARQYARDVWIPPRLQEFFQDVRFAGRLLVRDRGFALTAVLVLGLGIGVNNLMFTLIYTHTMRGLPIPDADRVMFISIVDDRSSDRPLSYPDFVDLQSAATFQSIAAYASAPMSVGEEGRVPERYEGAYITASAIDVIGRAPILGRGFGLRDDTPGAPPVAILGFDAWQTRYNGEAGILGRTILVNGTPATVIGVMPQQSGFPMSAEVWLPLSRSTDATAPGRDVRTLRVIGRLPRGVEVTDARLEIESIMERVAREHQETSRGMRARVMPINERFLGRATDPAWMAFLAASFIVVLVSSANVANLMISRSLLRTRELAIRTSLGASRSRIVAQMLTESVALAAIAGGIAIGVSLAGVRVFRSAIPANTLPYWIDYTMDLRVFGALLLVALASVLVFGLVPALQASKTDVNRVLKDGGRSCTTSGGSRRWTAVFLTAEFALTIVLLANAVAAFRGRAPRVPSDAVLKTSEVLTATLTLPTARYSTPVQRADFFRRLDERLRSIQGISAVSFASVLPSRIASEQRLDVEGAERGAGENAPTVFSVSVAPGYFATLALPLQRGRDFDANDGAAGHDRAIVNHRFVELFLSERDPIGLRISITPPNAPGQARFWVTIVGVAPDIRQRPTPAADPVVYLPLNAASPATAELIARSSIETEVLTSRLREELLALDPNLPLYRVMTLARAIDEAEWNGRVSTMLILSITIIAVTLSVVGLYAVTSYTVAQRAQELGIRVALGATPWQMRWFVLRRATIQVVFGLIAGVLCTFAWNVIFASERADISFASPVNLVVVTALLSAVVVVACFVPARRATRLDPVLALRNE